MMLDVIMEECPQRLKKKLLSDLLEQMRNRETDAIFFLLFILRFFLQVCKRMGRITKKFFSFGTFVDKPTKNAIMFGILTASYLTAALLC